MLVNIQSKHLIFLMNKLKDQKIALVTGASTGIGKSIAQAFINEGYFLILLGRDIVALNTLVKGTGEVIKTDLSSSDSLEVAISVIKDKYSYIDTIVNVAGVYHDKDNAYFDIDFDKYSNKQITETMSVGLLAPMVLCHDLLPLMRNGGKIINVSGTFESGAKGWLPYYVSKKALEDFTIGLADELKDRNIQVNCISPSDTLTESYTKFFPQYANPETCLNPSEISEFALSLMRNASITGQIVTMKR